MKTVTKAKGGFRFFYWFIDLLAIAIALSLAYLLWCFAPLAYDKIKEQFKPKLPQGLIKTNPKDEFCPEESNVLKEMYSYDHDAGKKRRMLVGSNKMITDALTVIKDKDNIITHVCYYN